jgi:hypothetical protein
LGFDDNVFLRGLEIVGFGGVQCRDVFMFKSNRQISTRAIENYMNLYKKLYYIMQLLKQGCIGSL